MLGEVLPTWARDYVGIPFLSKGRTRETGCDCYGLYRLVYTEQRKQFIPDYDKYYDGADVTEQVIVATSKRFTGSWYTVDDRVRCYDLLVFNIRGFPVHVGIALNNSFMLHTLKGHAAVIEPFNTWRWKNRLEGAYRWRK